MTQPRARIFYFERWIHSAGPELMAREPEMELIRLEQDMPPERIAQVLASAHGYQIGSTRDELLEPYWGARALLARSPELLVISAHGAGYDTVDVDDCTAAGVIVVNQSGANREAVGEHVLGMMLCLTKRMIETDRALRRDRDWYRDDFVGHDFVGRTIGIVGLGNTGSRVAELCGAPFGMRVIAYDPYIAPADFAARGARRAATLEELLAASNFVSINCPRTDETEAMIGAREFALMRPGAIFVTTARGGIHDEDALAAALGRGHLAGAGLDVWDPEPPALDHPLLAFDNVILSPHVAGATDESRRKAAEWAVEQWRGIWRGERPPRLINPEAWPAYAARFERIRGRPVVG